MKLLNYIWLFVLLIIAGSCDSENPEIVAWVNDEPVTKSEIKHWMLLEKANVYNYFYRKYGIDDSDNFWTQKHDDEIPLEMLKEVALEEAKKCKIQQILAIKKGIIKTTNFDEIIGELEKVNAERKSKVEKSEPVYGPVQFTSRTYFFHVFDKMVIELKNELAKDELKPDEEVLMNMQKESTQPSRDISGFLVMQYVDGNYEKYIATLMIATETKLNNEVYNNISLD